MSGRRGEHGRPTAGTEQVGSNRYASNVRRPGLAATNPAGLRYWPTCFRKLPGAELEGISMCSVVHEASLLSVFGHVRAALGILKCL